MIGRTFWVENVCTLWPAEWRLKASHWLVQMCSVVLFEPGGCSVSDQSTKTPLSPSPAPLSSRMVQELTLTNGYGSAQSSVLNLWSQSERRFYGHCFPMTSPPTVRCNHLCFPLPFLFSVFRSGPAEHFGSCCSPWGEMSLLQPRRNRTDLQTAAGYISF